MLRFQEITDLLGRYHAPNVIGKKEYQVLQEGYIPDVMPLDNISEKNGRINVAQISNTVISKRNFFVVKAFIMIRC